MIKNNLSENIEKQIILGLWFWPTYNILSNLTSNFEKLFLLFTIIMVLNEYFLIFNIKKIKAFIWTILLTTLFLFIITTSVNFYYGFWSSIIIFKFIYEILLLCIIVYMIKPIKSKEIKKSCLLPKYLFSYKENEIKILNGRINDKDIPSILIDQKIGTGKSTLIDHYIKNVENSSEIIYIKLPLIENIIDFKRIIFQEIQIIFKKNNISSPYFKNLLKYFSNVKISNLEFSLNKRTTTLWDDLKELEIGLLKLEKKSKKILIVIDDIERVQDANLIKNSISFLGEVGEYFRGTSTTILYLADKEEVETRIKKMKDNYKIKFLDKYFMSSLKISSPMIGNLSGKDIKILIHEIFSTQEVYPLNVEKYENAIIIILNVAKEINEFYINTILELRKKKEKITSELIKTKEFYNNNKDSNTPNLQFNGIKTYQEVLNLENKENKIALEIKKLNNLYEDFEINNNLRNIKRFLKKTLLVQNIKCHTGINIALYSIFYFIEFFYPIYTYSITQKKVFLKEINNKSDIFNLFYTNILKKYSYTNGVYSEMFSEKCLLIFHYYSTNGFSKEYLTIGEKILLNIFEDIELEKVSLEELKKFNMNLIVNEMPNDPERIEKFFKNEHFTEDLYLGDKLLKLIIILLKNYSVTTSKSTLENIISLLYKNTRDPNFYSIFVWNRSHEVVDFENIRSNDTMEKVQILKDLKEVLIQINEENQEKLNDIYIVLDKHIKTPDINIMFESDLGREEEEGYINTLT